MAGFRCRTVADSVGLPLPRAGLPPHRSPEMRRSLTAGAVGLVALSLLLAADRPVTATAPAGWPDLARAAPRQGGGAEDAAVVVGIGDYLELPGVPGAAANARDWERYFLETRRLRPSRVHVLVDREARKERIERLVADAAGEVGRDGTLWFVFIGHGAPSPKRDEGVLVTYDAGRDVDLLYGRSLSQGWLFDALGRGRQARAVVLLDACFSGQGTVTGEELAPGMQVTVPISLPQPKTARTIVLTAGKTSELAGPLPGLGRPAFSYLALGALRGWADASEWSGDQDGSVTAAELVAYTKEALAALVRDREQEPQLSGGAGDAILARGATEQGPDLVARRDAATGGGAVRLREPVAIEKTTPIRPEEGRLIVEGTPPGATVTIRGPSGFGASGRLQTTLPWGPATVPVGAYTVAVSAPGHDEQTRPVELYADRTELVRVELTPSTGVLEVTGEPAGAKVDLRCEKDFQREFGLPATLTVPRGTCTVVVERSGYERFERSVAVPGGQTATVAVALQERGGRTGPAGIEWVRIEGGTFAMGSTDGLWNEKPAHTVRVPTFELAKTAVTVGQYRACVAASACTEPGTGESCNWGKPGREDYPANCVDWNQAVTFSGWAGGRLPSEAEREYAARSGGWGWTYPWGNDPATCDRAVMGHEGPCRAEDPCGCGQNETWPVCSKPQGHSAQGICDLAGNVWEWVQDWYHDSYEGAPTDGRAWEQPTGSHRICRGGCWSNDALGLLAARRNWNAPGLQSGYVGFRPAKSSTPTSP